MFCAEPWFLYQHIRASPAFVEDLHSADVVFVYDYCYTLNWLANLHVSYSEMPNLPQYNLEEDEYGAALLKLYDHIAALPAYQEHQGSNFVIYQGHTGFATGKSVFSFFVDACVVTMNLLVMWRYVFQVKLDTDMRWPCVQLGASPCI